MTEIVGPVFGLSVIFQIKIPAMDRNVMLIRRDFTILFMVSSLCRILTLND
jgi:hypothetical protein